MTAYGFTAAPLAELIYVTSSAITKYLSIRDEGGSKISPGGRWTGGISSYISLSCAKKKKPQNFKFKTFICHLNKLASFFACCALVFVLEVSTNGPKKREDKKALTANCTAPKFKRESLCPWMEDVLSDQKNPKLPL